MSVTPVTVAARPSIETRTCAPEASIVPGVWSAADHDPWTNGQGTCPGGGQASTAGMVGDGLNAPKTYSALENPPVEPVPNVARNGLRIGKRWPSEGVKLSLIHPRIAPTADDPPERFEARAPSAPSLL